MPHRHPKKPIQEAIKYAVVRGWRVEKAKKGHNWGFLLCPGYGEGGGCEIAVYSTPKVPEDLAERIRKRVDRCTHGQEG